MNATLGAASTLVLITTSCAPATPPATETTSAPVQTADAAPDPSSAAPDPPAAPSASATAAPADTRVRDACAQLCDRVATSCPKGRDEACRVQCAQQEAKLTGCEAEAEGAFLCQLKAKDSFCDNVVSSSCVDAFTRMQRCHRGEKSSAVVKGAPEGWKAVTDDTWGVSMLMPPGASIDAQAKSRTWKASRGSGVYEVTELPRPKKLDHQAMVKLVVGHVGVSCQKDLRLTGLVETDKLTTSRFETSCSSGAPRYGRLWIDAQRVLILVVRDESESALRDSFLHGIKAS